MKPTFADTLRALRETKFPGQSLRRVGETLTEKHGFRDYFYTQLNKMEMGVVLPSSDLLGRLMTAYGASNEEKVSIYTAYAAQTAEESFRVTAEDLGLKSDAIKDAAEVFYRKVKKPK